MLTKEELKNTYLPYTPEITWEVFEKIIDKLEGFGFRKYSFLSREGEYSVYHRERNFNILQIKDGDWTVTSFKQGKLISLSDILGEKVELIKGGWYTTPHLNLSGNWVLKFEKRGEGERIYYSKAYITNNKLRREKGYIGRKPEELQPADMKEVYKIFPEEKPKENLFPKYIVVTKKVEGKVGWENFCYKNHPEFQKEQKPEFFFIGKHEAIDTSLVLYREATPEEIAEYENRGEPYNVTTIKKQEELSVFPSNGYCIYKEKLWDFLVNKFNSLESKYDGKDYLAWNNNYSWSCNSSSKPYYEWKQIKKFIKEKKRKDMEKTPLKVGDRVKVLEEPSQWSESIGGTSPLDANLTYPFEFTLDKVELRYNPYGEDWWSMLGGGYGWVYDPNIFKKVEEEGVVEWSTLEDRIYCAHTLEDPEKSFIFSNKTKNYICVHKSFWSHTFSTDSSYIYTEATPDQIAWFEACEKENKFISREEIGENKINREVTDFILPKKWCIKGSPKMMRWQTGDMDNKCSALFSSYSDHYYTSDPKLEKWHITDGGPYGTLITFDQFVKYVYNPMKGMGELSALPEKWCVRNWSKEDWEIIRQFDKFSHYSGNGDYYHYDRSSNIDRCLTSLDSAYTELTLEQFKNFVLNQPEEIDLIAKARLDYPVGTVFEPAHVQVGRCIVTNTNFKERNGDIYALTDEGDTWDKITGDSKYGDTSFSRLVYHRDSGRWAKIIEIGKVNPITVLTTNKWYSSINSRHDTFVLNMGNGNGCGFWQSNIKWRDHFSISVPSQWVEADMDKVGELLERYAKANYPEGTKYKCSLRGGSEIVKSTLTYYRSANGVTDGCGGYVFYRGKWAEKISVPEEKEELEKIKSTAPSSKLIVKDEKKKTIISKRDVEVSNKHLIIN